MILGTAAYMAPEQARGRPADKRADLWAFGCVLYEMLTGHRVFEGHDVSETLAFVITPDGQRLLMLKVPGAESTPQLVVVKNWFEELKRLVLVN